MSDELGVDVAGAVEGGFEGEDDEHAGDALLDPAETAALPGPELRADEVDDRDVEFFQLARETEVDVGEIDEDGDVGPPLPDGSHETAIGSIDTRHVTDDFSDSHMGDIFGADDAIKSRGFHLFAAEAEAGGVRMAVAQFGDELGAVVVAAGFAGREKDSRIGWINDGTSVDFLEGIVWHKVRRNDFERC